MTLTPREKKQLQTIGKTHNLRFIILHGSYAKGKEQKGSDLDIAILGFEAMELQELLDIHGKLGEIFGDSEKRELDLKTLHNVDPLFRYLVTSDGILLYGDKPAYEEFKAYAFRDFMDSEDLRILEYTMTLTKQTLLTKSYAHS